MAEVVAVIVDDDGESLVLIGQEAHAHLTGELAASLPTHVPHRSAFVAAARVHDNGWREADRAATVDSEGRPHTFTSAPDPIYEELWRRGIARAAAVDALVGLLVGIHGARFFKTRQSAGMRRLLAEERCRQDAVLVELGLGGSWDALPAGVALASEWIAMLDALSLLLCGASLPERISPRVAGEPYTVTRSHEVVTVEPWPYAGGACTFTVTARRIRRQPYASDEALRRALSQAEPYDLSVAVAPSR
ncbi:DUF3891 family protein [Aquisalimonas sp.]|uniref:DUF3891 family protein n=1 Tax=Aquisalimonas sp. TaxID=1872621 RepID=UPI0025BE6918|nr:DUF3891 family protein [Aquisalimonas sp.]